MKNVAMNWYTHKRNTKERIDTMKKKIMFIPEVKTNARSNIYTFIILYRKRTRLFVIKFKNKN